MSRTAEIARKTAETDVTVSLDLDGDGSCDASTGIGFFDHMLTLVAHHGLVGLKVRAHGDVHVDDHHTVEDVGIAIGAALRKALGNCSGIVRMGHAFAPMDEALVLCAIDVSGRGILVCELELPTPRLGDYTTELTPEFFRAVAHNAGWTVHLKQISGSNTHHLVEAAFKAFARAARMAVAVDPRVIGVPSTKGVLGE
ncbi:MAG: imidazoleglycerol-phosphate dehydratase HisB [Armatimonadetes bacterium]|nr:imidazoleglycerol-phosphate dehydratase HisB [Armatimonadota bacterium]MDE2208008.1 imidazoleglycerol-phosphate dehydratase HisB [Armatimonadota bacterium]